MADDATLLAAALLLASALGGQKREAAEAEVRVAARRTHSDAHRENAGAQDTGCGPTEDI